MQNLEGAARGSQNEAINLRQSNKVKEPIQQEQLEPLISEPMVQAPGMVSIAYMAGSFPKDELMRFKRMVFRATRGKAFTYFEDLSHEG